MKTAKNIHSKYVFYVQNDVIFTSKKHLLLHLKQPVLMSLFKQHISLCHQGIVV